ncbi:hypothetical protein Acr_04g0005850 [Actinidia rufa]|uniref:Uncharacterized protein n=1 Tax=Actinidia rufa TaxID=165716 RepID=A0A7J0EJQ0_9ERIC|nr:hypothetical protein Acr_04g0005850 [Actinidia rufa]
MASTGKACRTSSEANRASSEANQACRTSSEANRASSEANRASRVSAQFLRKIGALPSCLGRASVALLPQKRRFPDLRKKRHLFSRFLQLRGR